MPEPTPSTITETRADEPASQERGWGTLAVTVQDSRPVAESDSQGLDLLRLRWLRAILVWPPFPYLLQAVFLAAFVGLAVLGWGQFTPLGVPDKLFAKTNLVTLLVWGLWWPGMVWIAVWLGRLWCAVCPLRNWWTPRQWGR